MTNTIHRLKERHEDGEVSGFTLIEILVVIVVLGILAAVVLFALGGVTGQSAVASCQADGATVTSAISAFNTQNPNSTVSSGVLTGSSLGGPYLQSWPDNLPHYRFYFTGTTLDVAIAPSDGVTATSTGFPYTGPSSCIGVS
jgi:general secretion pathway protein G